MLALDTVRGVRVVGPPAVLDALATPGRDVLRFAPDDAFVLGEVPLGVDGADHLVADERGFAGCWLDDAELAAIVLPHLEWTLPTERPALAQGLVAGVPAKLWLTTGRVLLLCAAAHAHELLERLR